MIIKERSKEEVIEYCRQFTLVGEYFGNGFSFPCDEQGNLLPDLTDSARNNFEWCLSHPEKIVDNGVIKFSYIVTNPAINKCNKCGYEFSLENQFLGACECPACGQWYNLSGQELLPPDQWGE